MYSNLLDQCVSLVARANILICKDAFVCTMDGTNGQILILIVSFCIIICSNGLNIDQVLFKLS